VEDCSPDIETPIEDCQDIPVCEETPFVECADARIPAEDCQNIPVCEDPPFVECVEAQIPAEECQNIPVCEDPPFADCVDEGEQVEAVIEEQDFAGRYCDVPWLDEVSEPTIPEAEIFRAEQEAAAEQEMVEADEAFDLGQPVSPEDMPFDQPLDDLTDELPTSPH